LSDATGRQQRSDRYDESSGIELQPRALRTLDSTLYHSPWYLSPWSNSAFDWDPLIIPEALYPNLWDDPNYRENQALSIDQMRTDIHEEKNRYLLHAELPGVDRDSIRVTVNNGVLTIRAEKRIERVEGNADQDVNVRGGADDVSAASDHEEVGTPAEDKGTAAEDTDRDKAAATAAGTAVSTSGERGVTRTDDARREPVVYRRIERIHGVVQRSFTLPPDVDLSGIDATYDDSGILTVVLPRKKSDQRDVEVRDKERKGGILGKIIKRRKSEATA